MKKINRVMRNFFIGKPDLCKTIDKITESTCYIMKLLNIKKGAR